MSCCFQYFEHCILGALTYFTGKLFALDSVVVEAHSTLFSSHGGFVIYSMYYLKSFYLLYGIFTMLSLVKNNTCFF